MENEKLSIIKKPTAQILLLIFSLFLHLTITTAKVTDQELDSAISALRSNGYTLFPNAIATSDLGLRLLTSNTTFTLFAPPDPLLYSLDLSSWAPHYTSSLLRHVSPSRLATSDLRHLTTVKTLLPRHPLHVEKSLAVLNGSVLQSVKVDGVRVVVPDLFLGPGIAVHGLGGILVGPKNEDEDEDYYGEGLGFDEDWVSPAPEPTPMRKGIDHKVVGHGKFSKFNHWFTF